MKAHGVAVSITKGCQPLMQVMTHRQVWLGVSLIVVHLLNQLTWLPFLLCNSVQLTPSKPSD